MDILASEGYIQQLLTFGILMMETDHIFASHQQMTVSRMPILKHWHICTQDQSRIIMHRQHRILIILPVEHQELLQVLNLNIVIFLICIQPDSARILAVRNIAGYFDYCNEPLQVYWSQSFREKIVWEIVGRVCHLLADVNTPAHALYDQHDPFFGGSDFYENAMGNYSLYSQYDYLAALNQNNQYGGAINVLNKPNPLKYLFYTSAQIAGHFPSSDVNGNNNAGLNEPFSNYPPLQSIINSLGQPPTRPNFLDPVSWSALVPQIASTSFVYSIRATAAFLHWFANSVNIIPPPPPPLSATISGSSSLVSGQTGNWTVTASGGRAPYSYTWSYYIYCPNSGGGGIGYDDKRISNPNTGIEAYECGYWINLSTTTNSASRTSDGRSFLVKCIVKDVDNATKTVTKYVSGPLSKDISQNSRIGEEAITESLSCYPNPFNPSTKINVVIPNSGMVTLKIYDILGREVAVLANEVKELGKYEFDFNANNLPSGTYISALTTNNGTMTQKLLLVK